MTLGSVSTSCLIGASPTAPALDIALFEAPRLRFVPEPVKAGLIDSARACSSVITLPAMRSGCR